MVAATLVLLFPRKTLLDQVAIETRNDPLTVNYLTSLLRTDPHNVDLRILLAEKKISVGALDEAAELIGPLKIGPDAAARRRALLLELRMADAQLRALPERDTARPATLAKMRRMLDEIDTEAWDPADLAYLARQAMQLRHTALAERLLTRLAATGQQLPSGWMQELAQSALADSDYRSAARLYFAARERATDAAERRRLYLTAVATLQSGNLLDEALAAAEEHLGDLANDEQTLAALTRLALAAGKPALAERYVKRMLRMGGAGEAPGTDWLAWLIPSAHAADSAPAAAAEKLRPYDEKLYTLAYDVFLANGNLADAYRVARAAVTQTGETAWREKLAQVAEWNGKPQEALEQWLALAKSRRGADKDKAVQAVLRLAPGLFDFDALIFAWGEILTRRALTADEWRDLADTYEQAGRPADGIALLAAQAKRGPIVLESAVLEPLATLQERSGRIDDAIASYQRLIVAAGSNPVRAVKLASLYFTKGDFAGAYRVLLPLKDTAGATDLPYWKSLADVAWQLQQDDTAATAYGKVVELGEYAQLDIERLLMLMRAQQPAEAARIAEAAWKKFGQPASLLTALEIHINRHDTLASRRLLDTLTAANLALLARNAYFFQLRARYYQDSRQSNLALADLRSALALAPTNAESRLSLLYMLMETGQKDELQRSLKSWQADAQRLRAYWSAYAAAYSLLGESRRALTFLSREAPARTGDYLWLLGYADALDDNDQGGMAWRVRRHAWDLARSERARLKQAPPDREKMLAYVRLVTQQAPGDASLAVMRHLLSQSRAAAAPDASTNAVGKPLPLDAGATELALAWAISTEQDETAKAWLWTRYGKKLAAPAYAEVSVALVQNDLETLERLLAQKADLLPRYNRIDAARATLQMRLAQDIGFAEQEKRPNDDEIHLRLATDLLKSASSVIVQNTTVTRGILKGREERASTRVWVSPRLRLAANIVQFRQASQDGTQLTGVPGIDRRISVSALFRHPDGAETSLAIGRRNALSEFGYWRLGHTRAFGNQLSGDVALAIREYATESVPLSVGGNRDMFSAGLNYALSRREYLRGRVFGARYHTQQDSYLGSGQGYDFEAGYRIRTDYPDWTVRFTNSRQRFSAAGTADAKSAQLIPDGSIPPGSFFVPGSARVYALSAGFGDHYRENYSRAIRPFADFGRSSNSVTGSGYNWTVGAGGSVAGHDYFSVFWTRGKGGPGAGDATREFGLRYQYFFDRF